MQSFLHWTGNRAAFLTTFMILFQYSQGIGQNNIDGHKYLSETVDLAAPKVGDHSHGPMEPVSPQPQAVNIITTEAENSQVLLLGGLTQGNVFIQDSLNIGLQNGASGYRLSVDGKIMCEELKVQNSGTWPDYVFADDYPVMPIAQLEQHIEQHRHLPGIPSAEEIAEQGIMVGDMQRMMMEKIEELTLYIIAQEKRIAELEEKAEAEAKEIQDKSKSKRKWNRIDIAADLYRVKRASRLKKQTQVQMERSDIPTEPKLPPVNAGTQLRVQPNKR